MPQPNPVLVEVTRGSSVESAHRGAALVLDAEGRVVKSWGDTAHPVYPRSSIKPLQAVPLITSGAADAFDLGREEIALACASHSGEPAHTSLVSDWLARIGYRPDTLACGAHPPQDKATRQALLRQGGDVSPLHNNCSGKHAGFLTICRHLGVDPAGYVRPDHPVQRMVRDAVSDLTACDLSDAVPGIDGCGIPVYRIPLRGLATAMTKFSRPDSLDPRTADALGRIHDAMSAHPYLVAGRGRFCTALMQSMAPGLMVKTGAEGVFCAAVPESGWGIALKIDDGATRASEVALGGVLRALGVIDASRLEALRASLEPDVHNVSGAAVGVIRPSSDLLEDPVYGFTQAPAGN
jgi:L-asparaginase II